jgi:hypothetical protein
MPRQHSKRTTKRVARKPGARETEQYRDSNGELVLDMVAVERNHKRAAEQVLALLDSEIMPLWLKEAVEDAIVETGRQKIGSSFTSFTPVHRAFAAGDSLNRLTGRWLGVDKDPKVVKILADLFCLTSGNQFTLHLSEREKLARAISEILNSKITPGPLRNAVGDFVTDICTPLLDDSPEIIEKALALEEYPPAKPAKLPKGGHHVS